MSNSSKAVDGVHPLNDKVLYIGAYGGIAGTVICFLLAVAVVIVDVVFADASNKAYASYLAFLLSVVFASFGIICFVAGVKAIVQLAIRAEQSN